MPEDSSGKALEDGDDYQFIDMGEESLFLSDPDRLSFLNDIFAKRLELDSRLSAIAPSLKSLLGRITMSKTEFARRLREIPVRTFSRESARAGHKEEGGRVRGSCILVKTSLRTYGLATRER